MSKFIIENRSDADDALALKLVQAVIGMGRVSNDGKQFCYYTTFTVQNEPCSYGVEAGLNKGFERFIIVNETNN